MTAPPQPKGCALLRNTHISGSWWCRIISYEYLSRTVGNSRLHARPHMCADIIFLIWIVQKASIHAVLTSLSLVYDILRHNTDILTIWYCVTDPTYKLLYIHLNLSYFWRTIIRGLDPLDWPPRLLSSTELNNLYWGPPQNATSCLNNIDYRIPYINMSPTPPCSGSNDATVVFLFYALQTLFSLASTLLCWESEIDCCMLCIFPCRRQLWPWHCWSCALCWQVF